ncbi:MULTISPECIES: hypothetical protein [unclassified Tolypothrix]|uniref:hypothetical protein n=1 Tax=unclassified Tolypothrix TaxID=2649714 RepID=UPI0005EAA2FD|nr:MULTISPECIES: hypothetical protein [unclassified Tolypothrix]BAY93940.1 hypothetical protein NIES3275_59840 [Microchaete diplosiphon NIES-3275]EKF03557.1 hypothetical protein FDUTEX481_02461 [Tolypothrix sp. PCC 7601]MBE9084844.1 hypothetical protein [Tolypothrix sp. LEGE 11397]UYD27718.1 hypothetical protein HGR01_06530 [Tolypothrix sp. PCC 7712]UYD36419.1 hypothetical protein HG267_12150 [Tolypothrix sp. PCC 7601]
MKKQKFPLSLGLVLMLSSFLLATANKANAGIFVNQGTTVESSGYSGGSFIPSNTGTGTGTGTITPQVVPGSNVDFGPNGELTATAEAQDRLNQVATQITCSSVDTFCTTLIVVLKQGEGFDVAKSQLQTDLVNLGGNPESVQALINSLSGLLANGNVNINKLNDTINAWNDVIKKLSPESLKQLLKNEDIVKFAKDLKNLRQALKKAS